MSRASSRSGAWYGSQQRIVGRSVRMTYGGGGVTLAVSCFSPPKIAETESSLNTFTVYSALPDRRASA